MCGRFALYSPYPKLARKVGAAIIERDPVPRYNIPPGTWITSVRQPNPDDTPVLEELWWGYQPGWIKGNSRQVINARSEKIVSSGFYSSSLSKRRCLIPADGWYEWNKATEPKIPNYFCREDRGLIMLAGIWAERDDGTPGVAIITEEARGSAQDIHSRMPLALDDDSIEPWLDPLLTDKESIRNIAQHLDAGLITHWPVSTAVNKPSDDQGAELINPA